MDMIVLRTRVMTGLIFGAVVIGSILGGLWTTTALLVLIGAGSTWEYLRIVHPNQPAIRMSALLIFGLLSALVIYQKAAPQVIYWVLILESVIFIFLLIHLWRPYVNHKKIWWAHVVIYTMMPFLLTMYCLHNIAEQTYFILWILILIWMSDSAAYFAGSWWGKTKLFERISPKKTWEGFLGAGVFTIMTGVILWHITDHMTIWHWVILSVVIWIIGMLGDLYESSLKRTYNLKDSGYFLPGHGGFLDRFDSFIYVLPFSLLIMFFLFS